MAYNGGRSLSLAGKCLTLSLKAYHIILFVPLLFISFFLLPIFIKYQGTIGLNIWYETSLYTWIDVVAVMYICATILGVIGAASKCKIINFVFLFLATLSVLAPLTCHLLELDVSPTMSESKYNELALQMKSVEWSETKLEQAGFQGNDASVQWHKLQNSLRCCALNSTSNWYNLRSPQIPAGFLPSSCCSNKKVFIEYEYCFISDGSYVPIRGDLVRRSCISAAKSQAYSPDQNWLFLLYGALQLHQAFLNVIFSYFGLGKGSERKGLDKLLI